MGAFLIKKLGKDGIILLTDSDGGGKQIRSYLHGILGGESVHDAYIPKIEGKEKRKKTRSRAGLLGVEGMEREGRVQVLRPMKPVEVGRIERNTDKLLALYQEGYDLAAQIEFEME